MYSPLIKLEIELLNKSTYIRDISTEDWTGEFPAKTVRCSRRRRWPTSPHFALATLATFSCSLIIANKDLAQRHVIPRRRYSTMTGSIDTVDWERAIRTTPDRKAPSAPSRPVGFLSDLLVKLLLPPVVLLHVPVLALVRLWHGKRGPKWSFVRLVGVNMMRLNTVMLNVWFPRPRPHEEEWGIASEGKPIRDAISNGDLDMEVVKLDPVGPELRKNVADVKAIEGATIPGFWVKPKGVKTDKVILYIHGG